MEALGNCRATVRPSPRGLNASRVSGSASIESTVHGLSLGNLKTKAPDAAQAPAAWGKGAIALSLLSMELGNANASSPTIAHCR